MNTLKPGTPAMEAYLKVKKAIAKQSLCPGKVLTENYLCEALGMGRSPIRAALNQLSLDGFVELPPNRSARVSQYTQDQVRQIYSLRGMMLSHALNLTIDAYTEKDFACLEECLKQQEAAFHRYDFDAYLQAIFDFFYYMIRKARNPYLDEMADNILKRINVFLYLYDNFYSVEKLKTLPMHRKMLKLIQQKKVKSVMQVHKDISTRMLEAYDYLILNNTESYS